MFLHNDIYCKHLIEALIKLRNISDLGNKTMINELSVRNSDCYWGCNGFDSAQKKPCTNHDLILKFSRETRFVPIGAFHFVLHEAFSSVFFVLKVTENHIFFLKIRQPP